MKHEPEQQRESSGMEDWEMTEHMTEREGNMSTIFRYGLISLGIGIVIFVLLALGLDYFQHHFGSMFFKPKAE